jgi:hypothetical protein
VSAVVAAFYGSHAQAYQNISAQMASFHQQFVQALASGGASYGNTESAVASSLQGALGAVNAPARGLLGAD